MDNTLLYRLDETHVTCEILDGVMVLIHFESGLYYCVRGTGTDVCQFFRDGFSLPDVIARITIAFPGSAEAIATEIPAFVATLVSEKLLLLSHSQNPVPSDLQSMPLTSTSYVTPSLEKFDDLADQLLLDKIEEGDTNSNWSVAGPLPE